MDTWEGEYGTNFAIPGFTQWAADMKLPFFLCKIRASYIGKLSLSEATFKAEMQELRDAVRCALPYAPDCTSYETVVSGLLS